MGSTGSREHEVCTSRYQAEVEAFEQFALFRVERVFLSFTKNNARLARGGRRLVCEQVQLLHLFTVPFSPKEMEST